MGCSSSKTSTGGPPINDDILASSSSSSSNKPKSGRNRCYGCCCLLFILLIAAVMVYIFYFFTVKDDASSLDKNAIAMCGTCHCIIDDNDDGAGTCPNLPAIYTMSTSTDTTNTTNTDTRKRRSLRSINEFLKREDDGDDDGGSGGGGGGGGPPSPSLSLAEQHPELVEFLTKLKPTNPYTITCNPYENEDCQLTPTQQVTLLQLQDVAVCGIHFGNTIVNIDDFDDGNGTNVEMNVTTTTTAVIDSLTFLEDGPNNNIHGDDSKVATTRSSSQSTAFAGENEEEATIDDNNNKGDDDCPRKFQYTLQTYPSYESAKNNGAIITHVGSCGVCSTIQDLIVYMQYTDLTIDGEYCAKQGLISFDTAVDCYKELGLSHDCAYMWAANSANTAEHCFSECATSNVLVSTSESIKELLFDDTDEEDEGGDGDGTEGGNGDNNGNYNMNKITNSKYNGPAPKCELNDCLQCDEDKSGPIFQHFAGRTRRRSGLLSAIVRPCKSLEVSSSINPYDLISAYEEYTASSTCGQTR